MGEFISLCCSTLIPLVVLASLLSYFGIQAVYYPDAAWENHVKRKRRGGVVNIQRTKEWERTTYWAGIGLIVGSIIFWLMLIGIIVVEIIRFIQ